MNIFGKKNGTCFKEGDKVKLKPDEIWEHWIVIYVKGNFLDYLEDRDLIEGYWRDYYET